MNNISQYKTGRYNEVLRALAVWLVHIAIGLKVVAPSHGDCVPPPSPARTQYLPHPYVHSPNLTMQDPSETGFELQYAGLAPLRDRKRVAVRV